MLVAWMTTVSIGVLFAPVSNQFTGSKALPGEAAWFGASAYVHNCPPPAGYAVIREAGVGVQVTPIPSCSDDSLAVFSLRQSSGHLYMTQEGNV